jgi:hypothetical protein
MIACGHWPEMCFFPQPLESKGYPHTQECTAGVVKKVMGVILADPWARFPPFGGVAAGGTPAPGANPLSSEQSETCIPRSLKAALS